jgi:hypothetical protein
MEEIVKVFTDNGISVACVAFLMYYILTVQKENNKLLKEMSDTLIAITTKLGVSKEDIKIQKAKISKED